MRTASGSGSGRGDVGGDVLGPGAQVWATPRGPGMCAARPPGDRVPARPWSAGRSRHDRPEAPRRRPWPRRPIAPRRPAPARVRRGGPVAGSRRARGRAAAASTSANVPSRASVTRTRASRRRTRPGGTAGCRAVRWPRRRRRSDPAGRSPLDSTPQDARTLACGAQPRVTLPAGALERGGQDGSSQRARAGSRLDDRERFGRPRPLALGGDQPGQPPCRRAGRPRARSGSGRAGGPPTAGSSRSRASP